jgi:hypothetical protein
MFFILIILRIILVWLLNFEDVAFFFNLQKERKEGRKKEREKELF